jgi:hypothetical protein
MGNISVSRILPVFDTLLVLVTAIFGTAGLLRLVEPDTDAPMSSERARLVAEVETARAQVKELEERRRELDGCRDLDLDTLKALHQEAGDKQEELGEIQEMIADARGKLENVKTAVQDKCDSVTLENTTETLKRQIESLNCEKEELAKKVTQTDLDQADAKTRRERLKNLNKEIEELTTVIAQLQRQIDQQPDRNGLGGSYTGAYVLIECDDRGALVHPDRKRISLEPLEADIDWLKSQIKTVGAVALLTRPSGFEKSFDKFYDILTGFANERKSQGQDIVLILWPIESDETIEKYLSKGR